MRALAEAQSAGLEAWREARTDGAFARFAPALERLLELRREQADAIGHGGERYDALLDHFEPEMTTARLLPVLERLRSELVPLVDALDGALGRTGDLRRPPLRPRAAVAVHPRTCSSCSASTCAPAGRTGASTPSPAGRIPPTSGSPRASTREILPRRSSAPCTSSGTGSTSRALLQSTTAPRSPPRRRWGCTSRSRGSGRTWSAGACPSGDSCTRGSGRRSPRRWPTWSWRTFTGPSTGCGARPSGSRPTRSPTTCTSCSGPRSRSGCSATSSR